MQHSNVLRLILAIALFAVVAAGQRSRYSIEQRSGGPGMLCWKDTNGAELCLTIPSGALAGGAQTWTLPAEDVGGGGCWKSDGSYNLTVESCGAGGGSLTVEDDDSSPTYGSITTLRFDQDDGFVLSSPSAGVAKVDLNVSPAGSTLLTTGRSVNTTSPLSGGGNLSADRTLSCPTCVTTDTTQTITGAKTLTSATTFSAVGNAILMGASSTIQARNITFAVGSTYDVGTSGGRADDIYTDDLHAMVTRIYNPSFANPWRLEVDLFSDLVIYGESGAQFMLFVDSATDYIEFNKNLRPASGVEIGASGARTAKAWLTELDVSGNTTLAVGTGNFYGKYVGGASTAISCAGVGNGWQGVTTDNYLVWCAGGSRYRAAGTAY